MTFAPVLPSTGLVGWAFLTKTSAAQKEAFENSGAIKRDVDYFREEFPKISSAEELVSDRRLLSVALGAFGLEDDIDNRYFVRRILEDGTAEPSALSNLLADTRYKQFADAFQFPSPAQPNTNALQDITDAYLDQSFETAVGEQNPDFRLAMNLERTLGDIAQSSASGDTKWFTVMGSPPLRKVFEVAFRLPTSFANLPIDDQLNTFKDRAEAAFGTSDLSQFSEPAAQDRIVDRFLLQSQLAEGNSLTSQSTALTLLQSSTFRYPK